MSHGRTERHFELLLLELRKGNVTQIFWPPSLTVSSKRKGVGLSPHFDTLFILNFPAGPKAILISHFKFKARCSCFTCCIMSIRSQSPLHSDHDEESTQIDASDNSASQLLERAVGQEPASASLSASASTRTVATDNTKVEPPSHHTFTQSLDSERISDFKNANGKSKQINTNIDSNQGCSPSLLELVVQRPTPGVSARSVSPDKNKLDPPSYKQVIGSERVSNFKQALETDRICKNRLQRALSDAGQQSQGIAAVEAWVLNSKHTHLVKPEGAWWRDPKYTPPFDLNAFSAMRELARLEDQSLDNYHDTKPMQPGHGLVGKLWSDGHDPSTNGISEFGSYHGRGSIRGSLGKSASRSFRKMMGSNISHRFLGGADADGGIMMYWADIDFISNDEEHIPDDRDKSFIHAGIGQASGVVFNIRGYQGIVIYFARSDTPLDILRMESNAAFLIGAADCIGATLATDESRRSALHEKNTLDCFVGRSLEDISGASSIRSPRYYSVVGESNAKDTASHRKTISQELRIFTKFKLSMLYDKAFGEKKAKPPPAMPYSDCMWIFFGSSITLSLVLYLSQGILFWNEPDSYAFPVGPFGALVTLLFALSSAPVSQPRNIFYGTIIAGVTGLCFSYIKAIPHWLRLTLGTSTALTIMSKLGVTHPPAGALATIYSSGNYHWGHLALSLLANFIAVFMAILVNNLNKKRQYPQYWK